MVANTWIATSQIAKGKDAAKKACEVDDAKLLEIWSENEWNEVSHFLTSLSLMVSCFIIRVCYLLAKF